MRATGTPACFLREFSDTSASPLLGNIEPQRTDVGEFGGGEFHAATLASKVWNGIGSRKTVGFRPAAPTLRHNSKFWKKTKRSEGFKPFNFIGIIA